MPRRVRERMETYSIAMPPSMLLKIRTAAAEDDIAVRLWIREAIEVCLKFQERQREAKPREQVPA